MKPLALDLFCGMGGWTDGLREGGFEVIGVDIHRHPAYRGDHFIQADIRDPLAVIAAVRQVANGRRIAVVVRSPPCQRFSLARCNRGVDPVTPEDLELLKCSTVIVDAFAPDFEATENVRGAVPWFSTVLGKPVMHHGPYWFWGRFPPFLAERSGLRKGIYGSKSPTTARLGKQTKPKDPWASAKLPIELTRPMARAIMAELQPDTTGADYLAWSAEDRKERRFAAAGLD